jgi:heat shock protein HtpX
MFPEIIRANKWRTVGLLAFGFILLAAVGGAAGFLTGTGYFALVIAVVIATIGTFTSYYASDTIALTVTGAKQVDASTHPQLMNIVEEMALASGIPMPKVAVVQDNAPNAFATGRNPEHATVAVTSRLLEVMNREQLQGVLAHEMGHIANHDTTVSAIAVTVAGSITLVCDLVWRLALFGGGRRRNNNDNEDPTAQMIMVAISVVLLIIAPILAALMQAAVSRRREATADASAVQFTRNPAGLRSALEVLQADTTVVSHSSRATAHLWIESPLDRDTSKLNKLFDTHPPLSERIATLRKMELGQSA